MAKRSSKAIHDGKTYFTVGATAKILGISANKVRDLMGIDELEWTQFRVNGQLMIAAESIACYRKRLMAKQA